jgi:uncharacterized protein YjbI with pentapeptide repeats
MVGGEGGLLGLDVGFRKVGPEELAAIYTFADALADRLRPEFGVVQPLWDQVDEDLVSGGSLRPSDLVQYGPDGVGVRTWFGSHVLGLNAADKLKGCWQQIEALPWGGIRADALPDPWLQSRTALGPRIKSLNECARLTGLFGSYGHPLTYKPGPNWTPLPVSDTAPDGDVVPRSDLTPLQERLLVAIAEQQVLRGAELSGADLRYLTLDGMVGEELDLSGTHLEFSSLSEVRLEDAVCTRAALGYSDLTGAALARASLREATLRGACLRSADLSMVEAPRAHFDASDLSKATLRGAIFREATFERAVLRKTKARNTNFSSASLLGADFRGSDLSGADFKGANLSGANLSECTLTKTDFRGANLTNIDWTSSNFQDAIVDPVV